MSDDQKVDGSNIARMMIGGSLVILGLLVAFGWVMHSVIATPTERGQFGDQFGAINALFSGLAFLGLILTIAFQTHGLRLQSRDLRLQTEALRLQIKEFSEQKEEMKRSADAQSMANILSRRRMEIDALKVEIEFLNAKMQTSPNPSQTVRNAHDKALELIGKMKNLTESPLL
jgi:hypothetical protein